MEIENSKLSFAEFVEKFFPDKIVNDDHKKFIKNISEQIANNPKSTVIIYDGRGSKTKSLHYEYITHLIKTKE
jgi:cobalamin biosynthesis Co2+ chelatase CbiK